MKGLCTVSGCGRKEKHVKLCTAHYSRLLRTGDVQADRINNDGNYEPGNLRWATREVQANNTRRNKKREAA